MYHVAAGSICPMRIDARGVEVVVHLSAGGKNLGTGFFIGPKVVATCAHVLGTSKSVVLRHQQGQILGRAELKSRGKFSGTGLTNDDWALLAFDGEVFDWLEVGEADRHDRWTAIGFSGEGRGDALTLSGEVTEVDGRLQLFCQEASDSRFVVSGASGSPVVADGLVVGMLSGGLRGEKGGTKGGILHAVPMSAFETDDGEFHETSRRSDGVVAVHFGFFDEDEFELLEEEEGHNED
jgi:hypothetical protein